MNNELGKYKCPPVLICGFNRPDTLRLVVDAVRIAAPKQLFLSLDFPRQTHPKDSVGYEMCKRIFESIDWPCEIHRNYADRNMGCRLRMGSAISWFFDNVEYGIILEDDCVPDQTLFPYCAELLERYKDDERIGGVCGSIQHWKYAKHPLAIKASYYFDRLNTCAGWSTWRRVWQNFDPSMSTWPEDREYVFKGLCKNAYQERCFLKSLQAVYDGKLSSWAYPFGYSCLKRKMVFIHPTVNLITNIGFCANSTHTNEDSPWNNLPTKPMQFPLTHPDKVIPNEETEQEVIRWTYAPLFIDRVKNKLSKVLRKVIV